MEQILNSENKVLSKGVQVSFSLDEIYSNYPISVNISGNLLGSISGSCGENVTGDIFTAGVYEIPAGQNIKNFSAKLTNKCSSIDATLSLTVSNGALYCTVDYTFQGQSFMAWDVSGQISVTKIYQEIPGYVLSYPACPDGYTYTVTRTASEVAETGVLINSPNYSGSVHVYNGDSLTVSASAENGYYAPSFGFDTAGVTSKTNISGNVSLVFNTSGKIHYPIVLQPYTGTTISLKKFLYPPHPSFDCDGGCYCYCQDGSSVPWGEDCPTIYGDYNLDYITYGDVIYIQTSIPNGKFLDYVKVGNETFQSTFFSITANSDTIVDGKMTIETKLQSVAWRTVNSNTYTFSGTTDNITKSVPGIVAGRKTRITVSSGSYSTRYYAPGSTEPEWCDGGCYCYCADGGQVDYGSLCGGWSREHIYINEGLHTSNNAGTSISLSMSSSSSSLHDTTVSIGTNQLTFNGYKGGDTPQKTLTITKVEQYF